MADEEVTSTGAELTAALAVYEQYSYTEPDPADYGVWVPGIPVWWKAAWMRFTVSTGCAD